MFNIYIALIAINLIFANVVKIQSHIFSNTGFFVELFLLIKIVKLIAF